MFFKILALFYLIFSANAYDKVVNLKSAFSSLDLIPYVEIATTNGELPTSFRPYKKDRIHRDYSNEHLWYRFSINNKSTESLHAIIHFTSGTIGHTQLFKNVEGELVKVNDSVDNRGKSVFNMLELKLEARESAQFIISIDSIHHLNSKLLLSSSGEFLAENTRYLTLYSIYFGVLCSILLYNLIVFLFTKDLDFLNYILFLSFMGMTVLTLNGFLENFLFKVTLNPRLGFFSSGTVLFFFIFSYHFLHLDKFARWMKYLLYCCMSSSIFCMVINFTDLYFNHSKFFGTIIDLNILISSLAIILVSLKVAIIDKQILAKIYFLSWFILISCVLVWFSIYLDIVPYNFFTQHALVFGNMSEMIILSLALAYKLNIFKKEGKNKKKYQKLLRVLSHDIANSLFIILGQLKLTRKKNEEKIDWSEIDRIERAATHIEDILNNVKYEQTLDKLENISFERVDLIHSLETAIDIFEMKIQEKHLSVNIQKSSPEAFTLANPSIITHQVFSNILSNAIKFSPENGHISVSFLEGRQHHTVCIEDRGIGIPQVVLNKINKDQDIFSTIGTKGEKGTGFGISLVKSYLKLFKATFAIESPLAPEQNGTRITLTFPKAL